MQASWLPAAAFAGSQPVVHSGAASVPGLNVFRASNPLQKNNFSKCTAVFAEPLNNFCLAVSGTAVRCYDRCQANNQSIHRFGSPSISVALCELIR